MNWISAAISTIDELRNILMFSRISYQMIYL